MRFLVLFLLCAPVFAQNAAAPRNATSGGSTLTSPATLTGIGVNPSLRIDAYRASDSGGASPTAEGAITFAATTSGGFSHGSAGGVALSVTGDGTGSNAPALNLWSSPWSASNPTVTIKDGKVGVLTTSPTAALTVDASIHGTGILMHDQVSDVRIQNNGITIVRNGGPTGEATGIAFQSRPNEQSWFSGMDVSTTNFVPAYNAYTACDQIRLSQNGKINIGYCIGDPTGNTGQVTFRGKDTIANLAEFQNQFGTPVVEVAQDGVNAPLIRLGRPNYPMCNAANRGALVFIQGADGVSDSIHVCGKKASGAHGYVTLIPSF